jgi:predicted AAA+ superfamily ATPase
MSFRAFCQQFRSSGLPEAPVIRPCDFMGKECSEATAELLPWIDDLVSLWEVYCGCGGLPPAVAGQLNQADVDSSFIQTLFDIVYGDALKRANLTAAQVLHLLNELSKGLASPMNMSDLARTVGLSDYRLASRRVQDLIDNYIVWPCHKQGQHSFPNLAAQSKYYFTDPLLARLAHKRDERLADPDLSRISEQQIGQHLVRSAVAGDPSTYNDFSSVMYTQNASRKEIDFVGPVSSPLGFEGKYADTRIERESTTLRATTGGGVLATRALIGTSKDGQARFVPAAFVAFLLAE